MYNPWTCTKEQGNAGGRDSTGWRRRRKGRKKWNNCNNIINKIYLKINIRIINPLHVNMGSIVL